MTVAVKLDSCTFYVKIKFDLTWIVSFHLSSRWFIFESPTSWMDNSLASFWNLRSFFLANNRRQQLWMKIAAVPFHTSSLQHFFSSLSEACWALTVVVNTSSSCFISPRIRDTLLDYFFRILISLFLSLWYHLFFWILLFFCHNTSSKYMKSLRFLSC